MISIIFLRLHGVETAAGGQYGSKTVGFIGVWGLDQFEQPNLLQENLPPSLYWWSLK